MKKFILILSLIVSACGGGGGTSNPPTQEPKNQAIKLKASSYENKIAAALVMGQQNIPLDWKPCGTRADCGSTAAPASVYADFLQDGSYSLITHSIEYNSVNAEDMQRRGHIKLYQYIGGQWTDQTSKILKSNETEGCLHANKALVADFMQNGRPSIFFSCYGFDGVVSGMPVGEKQRMLLAQNDGTYKNIELPNLNDCACHSASAADVNGDGYPDIVLVDNYQTKRTIFFLINNKDGTFTIDSTRFQNDLMLKALFTVELIDFNNDGKYDIFVSGVENCACGNLNTPAKILYNTNGYFVNNVVFPSISEYGFVVDIIFDNGYVYLLRANDLPDNFFTKFIINRVKLSTLESTVLFESYYHADVPMSIITTQDKIVSFSGYYKVSVSK